MAHYIPKIMVTFIPKNTFKLYKIFFLKIQLICLCLYYKIHGNTDARLTKEKLLQGQ